MPLLSPLPEVPRLQPLARMLFLFLQSVVPTVPASFLTFGDHPLYKFYETVPRLWGISALDDMRFAGLIMKILWGFSLWITITIVFFRWYNAEETGSPARRVSRDLDRELMELQTAMTNTPTDEREAAADGRRGHAGPRRPPRLRPSRRPSRSRSGSGRYVERYLVPLVAADRGDRRARRVHPQHLAALLVGPRPHPDLRRDRPSLLMILSAPRCCRPRRRGMRQSALTLVERRVHPRRSCRAAGSCSGTAQPEKTGPDHVAGDAEDQRRRFTVTAAPGGNAQVHAQRAHGQDRSRDDRRHRGRRRATRSTMHDPTTLFESLSLERGRHHDSRRRVLPEAGHLHVLLRDPGPRGRGHEGHDHGDRPADDAGRRR